MSDSQTVTIPAADHTAPAQTRPVRLLRALAQNPEPLSAPALASLLAEPGRRRRLAVLLRPGPAPARAGRPRRTSRPRTQRTRPARRHLAHHHRRARLARRPRQRTSPRRGRRRPSAPRGRRTGPGPGRSPRHLHPPDSADQPQTRRSPAQRTRLHPRPDRRGLPRHQRENPPGPPLGPGGTQTPQKAQATHPPQPNPTPPEPVNTQRFQKAIGSGLGFYAARSVISLMSPPKDSPTTGYATSDRSATG